MFFDIDPDLSTPNLVELYRQLAPFLTEVRIGASEAQDPRPHSFSPDDPSILFSLRAIERITDDLRSWVGCDAVRPVTALRFAGRSSNVLFEPVPSEREVWLSMPDSQWEDWSLNVGADFLRSIKRPPVTVDSAICEILAYCSFGNTLWDNVFQEMVLRSPITPQTSTTAAAILTEIFDAGWIIPVRPGANPEPLPDRGRWVEQCLTRLFDQEAGIASEPFYLERTEIGRGGR